jgi:hypothetical protein
MATKTKKTIKAAKPSVTKKSNTGLVTASMAAINTTADNAVKWQKLASKLIKKSEKVRQQQINMVFDTAEALKVQFISGTDRMKDLIGYDPELVEKAKHKAMSNPLSKKVVGIVEDITERVSENPMVQKAEKATDDLKNMGIAKYKELKEDVLDQASRILDKGEAIIEEAKSSPKGNVTKKSASKKTAEKKATVTKRATTKAKVAPKKVVAKKTTTTKAKATKVVAKAAPAKNVTKSITPVKPVVKKETPKATPTAKVAIEEVKKATTSKVEEVKVETTK